jgi:hypothetical protein
MIRIMALEGPIFTPTPMPGNMHWIVLPTILAQLLMPSMAIEALGYTQIAMPEHML